MRSLRNVLSFVFALLAAAPALAQCDPVEEQKLLASDAAADDQFGRSVSISTDVAIVGSPWADGARGFDSGSAYIFERVGGVWVEVARLLAGDGAGGDLFGSSVCISGDRAVVGATGPASIYVFGKISGRWWQTAKFFAADSVPGDLFGISVAVSGDAIVVGAPLDDDRGSNSGSAYIFERVGSAWVQAAKLLAADGAIDDHFGTSVSISGDVALVGAPRDDDRGFGSGSAYIFERIEGSWVQTAKLLAADGEIQDVFGASVSISGDVALVGAPRDDDRGFESGSAYMFERIEGSWVQAAKLLAADGEEWDEFGISVSVAEDRAVVGARGRNAASGSAYIFQKVGGEWVETAKLLAADGAAGDWFGWPVSISGDAALVAAPWDDDRGTESGSAYIFNLTCSCPADLDADGDADVNDFFLFLDLFAAADPNADITGDGSIDVNDFFAYLDLFAAGCD